MPRQVDQEERRGRLAEALWRIAARDGFESATVRQVAAEAGVSVGLVQHYFSTKDEMLLFALQRVGADLESRLVRRIGALPEPRDPRQVVEIVLRERLPLTAEQRVHVQALVAWLGRAVAHPEPAEYMVAGTRLLRGHLAGLLRQGQQAGRVPADVDADRAAAGLLAFVDGLSSHVLQDFHTPDEALAVLDEHLDLLFGRR